MAELKLVNYAYYLRTAVSKKNVTLSGIVKSSDTFRYLGDKTKVPYVRKISVEIEEPSNIKGMIIEFNLGKYPRVEAQLLPNGKKIEILAKNLEVTFNYPKK